LEIILENLFSLTDNKVGRLVFNHQHFQGDEQAKRFRPPSEPGKIMNEPYSVPREVWSTYIPPPTLVCQVRPGLWTFL
jgi:hypothetical protein